MNWILLLAWTAAILASVQWWMRWRLTGGVTLRRFIHECRGVQGNSQRITFWLSVLAIITFPFAIAFDFIPPVLIPLQIPLAITAIFGTTGPVSFLVLGPSRWQTTETCAELLRHFPLLRPAAALEPMALGAIVHHRLGPSGDVRMSEAREPWERQFMRMVEEAPLVIFDGRGITDATRWELFNLLMSKHLPKLIIRGPVDDPEIANFLSSFEGVPVVKGDIFIDVVRAARGSRSRLLEWYGRRRYLILKALARINSSSNERLSSVSWQIAPYIYRFYDSVPRLIALHSSEQAPKSQQS